MREVVINKTDLLTVVVHNRENHREEFLKAQEGFRRIVIGQLDTQLQNARNGKPFNVHFDMPYPQDHTKDYDRVVEMLKMSVDTTIKLSSQEFDQYVMDNWQWSEFANSTNSTYASALGR